MHALGSSAGYGTPPGVWSCTLRERIIAQKHSETRDAWLRSPWPARGLGAAAPNLLDTYGSCPRRPHCPCVWRSSLEPQGAGRRSRRSQRPPRLGDTKPHGKPGQETGEFLGVSVSPFPWHKPLLLCQEGSPSTPRTCSSRPRRGSPLYLGTVTPLSTAVLPSSRWAAHVALEAPLRGHGQLNAKNLTPQCSNKKTISRFLLLRSPLFSPPVRRPLSSRGRRL